MSQPAGPLRNTPGTGDGRGEKGEVASSFALERSLLAPGGRGRAVCGQGEELGWGVCSECTSGSLLGTGVVETGRRRVGLAAAGGALEVPHLGAVSCSRETMLEGKKGAVGVSEGASGAGRKAPG